MNQPPALLDLCIEFVGLNITTLPSAHVPVELKERMLSFLNRRSMLTEARCAPRHCLAPQPRPICTAWGLVVCGVCRVCVCVSCGVWRVACVASGLCAVARLRLLLDPDLRTLDMSGCRETNNTTIVRYVPRDVA